MFSGISPKNQFNLLEFFPYFRYLSQTYTTQAPEGNTMIIVGILADTPFSPGILSTDVHGLQVKIHSLPTAQ